jgi:NhaP-type Na+/H+ or K+/H+ antiporter
VGVGSVATRTAWVGTTTYLTIDLLTLVIISTVLVRQLVTKKVTKKVEKVKEKVKEEEEEEARGALGPGAAVRWEVEDPKA